jgi:hypothetical protein
MYKLFHLSFTERWWPEQEDVCYVDVYTLGAGADNGGWRRHQHSFPAVYTVHPPPPVVLDGKLYMVIKQPAIYGGLRRMLLEMNVASEVRNMYYLPKELRVLDSSAAVHAFNLRGQLWVAGRVIGRRRVNFWVKRGRQNNGPFMLHWERRYTFYLDADPEYDYGDKPSFAWFDYRDGMMCYRFGDRLYKYDTTRKRKKKDMIQLPDDQRWDNVYGGYRPSLLSPHVAFDSASLIQKRRGKKRCSACPHDRSNNHHHGAKRIRKLTR